VQQVRSVLRVFKAKETIEGAGVRLHRAFGYPEVPFFDPFLMLDDFRADRPEDYRAGFPWHPHRGIETVTYMLSGKVEHGDSMGNAGVVGPGCIQWMTAGSGIIHQEMPQPIRGTMGGFQLWVNLPASRKMMDPRYQEIPADAIPAINPERGISIKVIAGSVAGTEGPVRDIVADPVFLDATLGAGIAWHHAVPENHTVVCYGIAGSGSFGSPSVTLENRDAALLSKGSLLHVTAGSGGLRFLLVAGEPIGEPVAWRGPIVMNTDEELRTAFRDYREGTFIRTRGRL
jgi:redox-sensitive bicupin YhaK (pirin superfamily)